VVSTMKVHEISN